MTSRAVRAWLAATLEPVGLQVFPSPATIGVVQDFIAFTRFPARKEPLSFGAVGALLQTTYTPSILVALLNPSNDVPQDALDGYVEALTDLLRKASTPASLTDATTGEVSELALVTEITEDPAPQNTLTASVLVPTLVEISTQAA